MVDKKGNEGYTKKTKVSVSLKDLFIYTARSGVGSVVYATSEWIEKDKSDFSKKLKLTAHVDERVADNRVASAAFVYLVYI